MTSLLLIAGFFLLMAGAEFLVRGSVAFARRLDISPLVVGLTVVAFGTSAPELVVSLNAALDGVTGISFGNVVGSNIANILLVLGATAVIWPIRSDRQAFMRDYISLLTSSVLLMLMLLSGEMYRWQGCIMLLLLVGFITVSYRLEIKTKAKKSAVSEEVKALEKLAHKAWPIILITIAIGLAGVIGGADILVDSAVKIARMYGVSEEIIGLTLIAFGTSIPELATSGVAALRRETGMALGNVIGSNIWNILLVLGGTAIFVPLPVPAQIMTIDIWAMMVATLLLLPFMLAGDSLSRKEGGIFLLLYVAYITLQYHLSVHV